MQRFDLSGKTALITGGNRGIGLALTEALAQAGAAVIIAARNAERNQQVVERLVATGYEVSAVSLDVADPESIERALATLTVPIDILINNAGICYHGPALDVSPEQFRKVIEVNLNGVWFCSQQVGRQMIERRSGSIINIGSMSANIVNRPQMQPAYNASKAAVHHLTRSLAAEWAPYNVRVNALAPGYIRTDMAAVDDPQFQRYWIDDTPMKRAGEPEELGPIAVYLASEASSFMTGEILVVDGGYTLF